MGLLRHGIAPQLEAEANRLIKESLRGVTKPSEKRDILTAWKDRDRHRREIPVGTPDASVRQGNFNRAWNSARPDLNSRDGIAGAIRHDVSGSLGSFVEEYAVSPLDRIWDQT